MALKDPSLYAFFLALFTGLLIGRVAGQVIVVLFAPRWLPIIFHSFVAAFIFTWGLFHFN